MGGGPAIALTSIEARTLHKLRIRIIPFLFLLYIVAYLDRINIGFAALTMNKQPNCKGPPGLNVCNHSKTDTAAVCSSEDKKDHNDAQ